MISTLPSFEFVAKKPMVADVDDAIWTRRWGGAARNLVRHAQTVVAGNTFLAEYFSTLSHDVHVIPTAVDIHRFSPLPAPSLRSYGVIGWSGTSGGYAYFTQLVRPIAELLARFPDWKIRFISDAPPPFTGFPSGQMEYRPWSPETEAWLTADMDIGLMPLDDSIWSQGKCSYKMLLYMACAVPVVVSDIGMNSEILRMAPVGMGVKTPAQWVAGLEALMRDSAMRQRMGVAGRLLVEHQFSIERVAGLWCNVLAKFK